MRFRGVSGPLARKVGLLLNRNFIPWFGSVCVLSAVVAAPLAAAAAEPAEGGGATLGEVVVTAQKRSQDVQKIGVAVSTMSGKDMETLKIRQPLDLAYVSPSLSTMNSTTDGTPLFLIRGVGLDDFNPNTSSGVGS